MYLPKLCCYWMEGVIFCYNSNFASSASSVNSISDYESSNPTPSFTQPHYIKDLQERLERLEAASDDDTNSRDTHNSSITVK